MRQNTFLPIIVIAMIFVSRFAMTERVHAASAEVDDQANAAGQSADSKGKAGNPPGYIEEGPLPEGFPPPGEVGKVIEKIYPLCRTYSAEGNNAFMRCFAYLSKQKHEMTAPVIMDYQRRVDSADAKPPTDSNVMDVARMHFVLADLSLDKPKQEGPVVVADMAQMRVLSIACQGEMTPRELEAATRKLDTEIAMRSDVVAVGPQRVLGYNSPMVPRDKQYWEVQVPIEGKNVGVAK